MLAALISYLAILGRVYLNRARQNVRPPFSVLTLVSEVPDQDELTDTGATSYQVQLDIYAADHASAELLKDAAYTLLNRPGKTFYLGDYYIGNCRVSSVDDLSELEYDGSASALVRKSLTVDIHANKEDNHEQKKNL